MIKRISLWLVLSILASLLISCSNKDQKYSYAELSLPLSADFYETEEENFDVAFTNGESVVAVIRLSFSAAIAEGIVETMTPTEFGKYWLKRCGRSADVKNTDSTTYATYYDNNGYFYLEAFYRSEYAYFVVLFAADSDKEEALKPTFLNYASGVRIMISA